jgi:NitT/TauT family transport system ATP-binding protein
MVTHDVEEAVRVADRVLVLKANPGQIATEIPVTRPAQVRSDSDALPQLRQVRQALEEVHAY